MASEPEQCVECGCDAEACRVDAHAEQRARDTRSPDNIVPIRPGNGWRDLMKRGGDFILDEPRNPVPVWGEGSQVLWASGESTMIAADTGLGKSTLAQQLVLARLGLRPDVLGFDVLTDPRRVLYIAADRPRQIARSLARMVTEQHRETLNERLSVWDGPLPFQVVKEPETLAVFALDFGAGTLIIDSLFDIAPKTSDDEVGGLVNVARQHTLVAGVEVMELHHTRKKPQDSSKASSLDDVYGSVWLRNGAGSVILLNGKAGDSIVDFKHVKQPAEIVGPFKVLHDHEAGSSSVFEAFDLWAFVRAARNGVTAQETARAMSEKSSPDRNEVEGARRKLDALVRRGFAHKQDGMRGGAATKWFAVSREEA